MSQSAPGLNLLPATSITTAVAAQVTTPFVTGDLVDLATIYAEFTYGSGGTTVDAWVQTSLDGGTTWIDIVNFHFTTSNAAKVATLAASTVNATPVAITDGSMAANTGQSGIIGDRFRVKYTTTGTYASTTLQVVIFFNDSGHN